MSAQGKVLVSRTSSCALMESAFLSPSTVMMHLTAAMVQMKLTAGVSLGIGILI